MPKFHVVLKMTSWAHYTVEAESEDEAAHIALNGIGDEPEDVVDSDPVVETVDLDGDA